MNITNHNKVKLQLAEIIQQVFLAASIDEPLQDIYNSIGFPPDTALGHYTYPCFNLAKKLKNAPNKIAEQLSGGFTAGEVIDTAESAGPYINFRIRSSYLGGVTCDEIENGKMFERHLIDNPLKTMIEYSQPNTHKELHVGHMRNLCLGDALIKLHRYCGYDIISATFPGDVGTHVAKCLWYFKYHNTEPVPEQNKGAWLGSLYSKGHLKLEEEEGTGQGVENKKQLSEILTQLEEQKGEFYDLWKETKEWSVELMNQVYDWAGVHFDRWYWESDVDVSSTALARKYFEKGVFIESQGTIGVDLTEYNLGFCMLLKSDGHGLYATKDIELARRKFEDFHIEKSVYIVDKRQAHHFAQVFKVLEIMGYENAKKCYHLQYDYVELPDGAMSSRKGNIVPIMQLIDNMHEVVKRDYLNKYIGEWEQSEIDSTADVIAKGAIKYGMIRIDPSRKIVFDMKEWLKIDGDSGPYLQYTYARINSLVKKLADEIKAAHDWSVLAEETELHLMVKLSEFNNQVVQACNEYKPNVLCNYLYELCKIFNNFYNVLNIRRTEDEVLKSTRVELTKCVAITLKKGLSLLGIPVPDRM